ncbi:hypothetical protein GHT06_018764 [Daphnia sinensis]|uniref:Uncharacterized protein n=1 Tax=Daphnia sinensis TaxID=1820382 RepID=A0AAD5L6G0_9CRUS|nr:hypothetical protein GHT06_018764 [Daphnia sinensis]
MVDVKNTSTEHPSVIICDEQAMDDVTFGDVRETSEKSIVAQETSRESLVKDDAVVSHEELSVAIIPEAVLDEVSVAAEVNDIVQQEPGVAPVAATDADANAAPVKKAKMPKS